MKYCSTCKLNKTEVSFNKNKGKSDGLSTQCRSCNKEYNLKTKQIKAEKYKIWWEKNKTIRNKAAHEYHILNKEKVAIRHNSWRQNNKDKTRYNVAKYTSSKDKRTPKWLSIEDLWFIKEVYSLAVYRTECTGKQWQVDHIVPLRGGNVSGLHVPWNLQILSQSENAQKNNTFLDDNTLGFKSRGFTSTGLPGE